MKPASRVAIMVLASVGIGAYVVGCGGPPKPAANDPNSKANAMKMKPGAAAGGGSPDKPAQTPGGKGQATMKPVE